MEYLEGCSTTLRCVARKVATVESGLVWFGGGFTMGTLFPDGWTCIWYLKNMWYNIISDSSLLFYVTCDRCVILY